MHSFSIQLTIPNGNHATYLSFDLHIPIGKQIYLNDKRILIQFSAFGANEKFNEIQYIGQSTKVIHDSSFLGKFFHRFGSAWQKCDVIKPLISLIFFPNPKLDVTVINDLRKQETVCCSI